MIELVRTFIIPAAYDVLPAPMASNRATAMLLAIGLQESRFVHRRQIDGPARGFWQFEVAGVAGVLRHPRTRGPIGRALRALQYDETVGAEKIQPVLEHNDVLAACFARCLLWTSSSALPQQGQPAAAWRAYLATWRPGRPRRETWDSLYATAWHHVPAVLRA